MLWPDAIDPRLRDALERDLTARASAPCDGLPRGVTIALVGHRGAGKSSLLPWVTQLTGLRGIDLDDAIEQRAGRPIRELFTENPGRFRELERETFTSLPVPRVVATGGGFLSHHGDLLRNALRVLVPITRETWHERMLRDSTRPRLKPAVSLTEELAEVWQEREAAHAAVPCLSLVDLVVRARRGFRARRVVPLPRGVNVAAFASEAMRAGADQLEVHHAGAPLTDVLTQLPTWAPVMLTPEGAQVSTSSASTVNGPRDGFSWHTERALPVAEAVAHWRQVDADAHVKHVEPVESVSAGLHLLETQQQLLKSRDSHHVTVLAMGPAALPVRVALAEKNEIEFVALNATSRSAAGQRLLRDVVREHRFAPNGRARLAVLGSSLAHSRSARVHEQPFDRMELPAETDVRALLDALRPWYRGFAVTAPFKERAAQAIGSSQRAVNTLVRTRDGWSGFNTDVVGAQWALEDLESPTLTVLGRGGVAAALMQAAEKTRTALTFVKRDEITHELAGAVMWTWPAEVSAPEALRFARGTRVGVIAYGARGRAIRQRIEALGGTAVMLGLRWFMLQAREQRHLWRTAS